MFRLSIAGAFVLLLLIGCSTPKEYTPPPKAALQDPLPGKSLVYLLRAPYDETTLSLSFAPAGGQVHLPKYRYTAISLEPGTYTMTTVTQGTDSQSTVGPIPSLTFNIAADQRLCFFLPAPEKRNIQTIGLVPLPIVVRQMQETGAVRAWTPATNDDVNWFVFYTKPYVE